MLEDYIGTIQAFGFNFPPRGWAFCDGQLLAISSNTALFSLLGTTFGGDGRTTFGLPDLRGRSMVHVGNGPGLDVVHWGERGGRDSVTLTSANLPAHNHPIINGTGPGMVSVHTATVVNVGTGSTLNEPDNGTYPFAAGGTAPSIYVEDNPGTDYVGGVVSESIISGSTASAGASYPVDIRNPFLGVYVSICMYGVYPSRS